jgi:hypothetical protein
MQWHILLVTEETKSMETIAQPKETVNSDFIAKILKDPVALKIIKMTLNLAAVVGRADAERHIRTWAAGKKSEYADALATYIISLI